MKQPCTPNVIATPVSPPHEPLQRGDTDDSEVEPTSPLDDVSDQQDGGENVARQAVDDVYW